MIGCILLDEICIEIDVSILLCTTLGTILRFSPFCPHCFPAHPWRHISLVLPITYRAPSCPASGKHFPAPYSLILSKELLLRRRCEPSRQFRPHIWGLHLPCLREYRKAGLARAVPRPGPEQTEHQGTPRPGPRPTLAFPDRPRVSGRLSCPAS